MSDFFTVVGRSCGFNSSIMEWTERSCSCCCEMPESGSRYHCIYDVLCQHHQEIVSLVYKFDHFLEMIFLKQSPLACFGYLDQVHPGKVIDYLSISRALEDPHLSDPYQGRVEFAMESNDLSAASFVTFPIHPKPHDVVDSTLWVQQNWVSPAEYK